MKIQIGKILVLFLDILKAKMKKKQHGRKVKFKERTIKLEKFLIFIPFNSKQLWRRVRRVDTTGTLR